MSNKPTRYPNSRKSRVRGHRLGRVGLCFAAGDTILTGTPSTRADRRRKSLPRSKSLAPPSSPCSTRLVSLARWPKPWRDSRANGQWTHRAGTRNRITISGDLSRRARLYPVTRSLAAPLVADLMGHATAGRVSPLVQDTPSTAWPPPMQRAGCARGTGLVEMPRTAPEPPETRWGPPPCDQCVPHGLSSWWRRPEGQYQTSPSP